QFDLVLVDAPCTGSGTWRRRPDAKWRLGMHQLETRMAEQSAILDSASRYVKPGGRLAYITCSIFNEENGAQVEAFLARAPEFRLEDHAALWQDRFTASAGLITTGEGSGITLSPASTGTDGFFLASMKRS